MSNDNGEERGPPHDLQGIQPFRAELSPDFPIETMIPSIIAGAALTIAQKGSSWHEILGENE
jgi:hypothetical protein